MKKKRKSLTWLLLIVIIFAPFIVRFVYNAVSCDINDVQKKIEHHLYEKYGEEFVVDQIGTRSSRGEEFYQARIYPESIIGTNREGDDYYYAGASVSIESFARLGSPADSYEKVILREKAINYLKPTAKKLFGDRVLLKPDIKYYTRNQYDTMSRESITDFEEARDNCKSDPGNKRMELDLDVYIFDRIEDEEEKEQRREEIFGFVQYLQEEGLFEYLEMRIVFMDERVLADSFDKYDYQIFSANKEDVYIEEVDRTVKLPPEDLRKEMSEVLKKEVEELSEEKMLERMKSIRKDKLSTETIAKHYSNYFCRVYSPRLIEERYPSTYNQGSDEIRSYRKKEDIRVLLNIDYILNGEGVDYEQ